MLALLLLSNGLGYTALRLPSTEAAFAAFVPDFAVCLLLNSEELAWRGYVLPRLQLRWNPLLASLVLGAIWMAFHAPSFCLRGSPPEGLDAWLFAAASLPLSVLLTRIFNAAAGSVLLPHLLHQSVHAAVAALPWLPHAAGSPAPAIISVLIALVLAVFAVVAWPSMWTRH